MEAVWSCGLLEKDVIEFLSVFFRCHTDPHKCMDMAHAEVCVPKTMLISLKGNR